jgi:catechol 2,3-dioxygenase-like lactoylglutathione lyase family enzyme
MEINGIAHVMLTVGNYEACLAFYEKLLPFLGLTFVVRKTGSQFYCIGGRTGIGIHKAQEQFRGERFTQARVGLHHLCLRARGREDVDAVYKFLLGIGATIVHPPDEGAWASGYYSVLFEDPDGIRIEVNHIPGKGLLEPAPRERG